MILALLVWLLAGMGLASEDHGAEGGTRTGPDKAVLEASEERGLKLSEKAVKRLGLQTVKLSGSFQVPAAAVVYFKEEAGVYVLRDGWYKLVEVEVGAKSKTAATVRAAALKIGDSVVAVGAALLRAAELDVLGAEEAGHGH